MKEKRAAYLAAGANEVWLVYPKSKRCEFYGPHGPLAASAYRIDWLGVFA